MISVYKQNLHWVGLCLAMLLSGSCRKFVEIPPPKTQLTMSNVFSNDAGAQAAMSAVYASLGYGSNFNNNIIVTSLSSDELIDLEGSGHYYYNFYQNALTSNDNSSAIWSGIYNLIFQVNAVLEGIKNTGISEPVRKQLTGESKFTRAYLYFCLVNLYGDVPYATTTDYQVNNRLSRLPVAEVYERIIADLKEAEETLNARFTESDGVTSGVATERLRPTSAAASALLARVYLYKKEWTEAATAAEQVLNSPLFNLNPDLNQVFLKNNSEAIWQLSRYNLNTSDGASFVFPTGIRGSYNISQQLMNAFEVGDKRKDNWMAAATVSNITYNFPYKYKIQYATTVTEYETVFRLAEQYLIRAEARAWLGNITSAIADLNIIRQRAGLPDYTGSTDPTAVLNAIQHERQVELFTEGHRWFDLKRTGNIDAVMSVQTPLKGGVWKSTQQLYPIPATEIQANPQLIQNLGY